MAETPEETLRRLWGEVADLAAAAAVLEWDQETCMPPRGQEGRGLVLATLAGLRHERLTAPALQDAIEAAGEAAEPGSPLAAMVREARRVTRRARRIPRDLARELAAVQSRCLARWQEARRQADFGLFQADLERMLQLKREEAAAVAEEGQGLYDALLDEYEPGAREAELEPLFRRLREELAPLVQAVAAGDPVDESPARGEFPRDAQEAFGRQAAERMGFDFQAGRLDASAHPFCTGFHPRDVRLTWRWDETDFRPAFFGILHEAGHGLYEQGLPLEWQRTPIGGAVSLGVHESQSRLWENQVGRSRAFWEWALPRFREAFPGAGEVTVDVLWPAVNVVRPSLIRVEADQVTYNLHVALRFGLEQALFRGKLEVADLPAAWDDASEELLGLRPGNAAEGVLQDIHWAMGAFGYFPTYTLGNLVAAQLWERARADLGDLDTLLARGELVPLREWLRERIHRHGSRWPAPELVEQATGRPVAVEPFLAHVRGLLREVYGVS